MLQPRSQIDLALRDTLITKAEGDGLAAVSRFYSLPRPSSLFGDPAWRKALRAAVWGPRGTLGCTHDFLEGLFSGQALEFSVTLDPADPKQVKFVSGPGAGFTSCHVGRLVRIRFIPATAAGFDSSKPQDQWPFVERMFFTAGPVIAGLPATSAYLDLAPFDSGYWTGCDWAAGQWSVDPAHTSATMSLFSFVYLEPTPGPLTDYPGDTLSSAGQACEFQILVDDTLLAFPPTYLLDPPGVDRDLVDVAMPDGGHIMDLFDLPNVGEHWDGTPAISDPPTPPQGGDPLGGGPHPLYFQGAGGFAVSSLLDLLLAAGVRAVERVHTFCTEA